MGRIARRPVKKQPLTKKMMGKRLLWAKKYQNWMKEDRQKVMFSDESHFFVQRHRSQHVRRSPGEKVRGCHIDQCVKHTEKKMFWGCFSYAGAGSLHPIHGMMNSAHYVEVTEEKVIPDMRKVFPDGSGVFQQDLAPCHMSKVVTNFFKRNKIKVLDWPGNSPDLNPIENLWSIIKCRLRKMDCTTKTKLIEATMQLWYHDEQIKENCENLIDYMPK